MCIIITDKDSDKHSIRSWSESHKCDTSHADYKFVSYNFIKKLTQSSCKKHAPSVFVMHICKISDENESSNKFSISSTTITSFIISSSADMKTKLLNYEDIQLHQLIHKYKKVFCNKVSDSLLSKWDNKHKIKIRDTKSVNINAYSLLKAHLDEQVKQVKDLLDKGLIRESVSSWGFLVLFIKKSKE